VLRGLGHVKKRADTCPAHPSSYLQFYFSQYLYESVCYRKKHLDKLTLTVTCTNQAATIICPRKTILLQESDLAQRITGTERPCKQIWYKPDPRHNKRSFLDAASQLLCGCVSM
jgi:hypothetical protein